MEKLIRQLADTDPVTQKEVRHFMQLKLDEYLKISGQIVRDLSRIGENAWCQPDAYKKLDAKYKARFANTKRRAILDLMKLHYCKSEETE